MPIYNEPRRRFPSDNPMAVTRQVSRGVTEEGSRSLKPWCVPHGR
jgi:hypothetical protein